MVHPLPIALATSVHASEDVPVVEQQVPDAFRQAAREVALEHAACEVEDAAAVAGLGLSQSCASAHLCRQALSGVDCGAQRAAAAELAHLLRGEALRRAALGFAAAVDELRSGLSANSRLLSAHHAAQLGFQEIPPCHEPDLLDVYLRRTQRGSANSCSRLWSAQQAADLIVEQIPPCLISDPFDVGLRGRPPPIVDVAAQRAARLGGEQISQGLLADLLDVGLRLPRRWPGPALLLPDRKPLTNAACNLQRAL
mmetsp:Transcript_19495/g.52268  ORF Transcript_19495/g.52268 Transcript_19495/m.52268 type:complete len:254 (+) Transcript_19495:322-1083(+)